MIYSDYAYLYPPRPEKKIPREMLDFYENRGFFAQVKKNGTCCVIFAKGDEVIFKTRHADDHKAWTPLPEHIAFFQGKPSWHVYAAELIHSKTPHIKNQVLKDPKAVLKPCFKEGSNNQWQVKCRITHANYSF
jgi:hypothetical protein